MKVLAVFFIFLVSTFSPFPARADFASSTNFVIERGVIDVGGSGATSTGFNLRTSLGQQGVGISTSTTFTVRGGFLHFSVPASATTAPTSSGGGGGGGGGGGSGTGGGGGGTGYQQAPSRLRAPGLLCGVDFNDDDRVDMVDLSILLYYYDDTESSPGCFDIDENGRVDFPDVSILMFYWTG